MTIETPKRKFLDQHLIIDSWNKLEPYFEDLINRNIESKADFSKWLEDNSELEAVLEEDLAWRYIKMTIDTRDEALAKSYSFFVNEIQPNIAPYDDRLNKKLIESPFVAEFENDPAYNIIFKKVRTSIELYREENIAIQAKLAEESQEYGSLAAAQTIMHEGKKITMQQAALFLKNTDEEIRKTVFEKIAERRRVDYNAFDELMDSLIEKRHQLAINAGFDNYRDYKMKEMGRFDYSVEDCKNFHASIKSEIVPLVKTMQKERLAKLNKPAFKPWDLEVDPDGKEPLKPFTNGNEMLEKTISMFANIDPYFADCIKTMSEMNHLDLESKDGKSPGGYNYPLYEIGVPFIFMNSVGSQRDLVTMVHEGGHAVHSFLSRDLSLTGFKNLPSEVAELASMSMELLSMPEWRSCYNEEDFLRAKKDQLESVIKILPWIAQVDEFQHWIYTNPNHKRLERREFWNQLNTEYGTGLTDWSGYEDIIATSWQRQLHIFEVPFYYIEYGIAQLGALGVWKNSLENKGLAIEKYKNALRLAYTKPIPEIYETAGVQFDFSRQNLSQLADFVGSELKKLQNTNSAFA